MSNEVLVKQGNKAEWAAGGGASSADVFIIHSTPDETFTSAQFDKTAEQIYEAYKSGKYCLVCLDGDFVPVESVKTDGARYQMCCYGFSFKNGQGTAVGPEFRTNDGVTWATIYGPPMLYNVCFSGLQIYGSGGRVYTISVDADGNITATAAT